MPTEATPRPVDGFHQRMLATSIELTLMRYERTKSSRQLDRVALKQWVDMLDSALEADKSVSQAIGGSSAAQSNTRALTILLAVMRAMPTKATKPEDVTSFLSDLLRASKRLLQNRVVDPKALANMRTFAQMYGQSYNHLVTIERNPPFVDGDVWPRMIRLAFS